MGRKTDGGTRHDQRMRQLYIVIDDKTTPEAPVGGKMEPIG
jgi:hypothetical protein